MTELAELELLEVTKSFGGTCALDHVSVGFERGQITCIIGPNGAGKTTLFHVSRGALEPDTGEVVYRGRVLNGTPAYQRARLGIGTLFQDVRVFAKMTLLENVAAAGKQNPGESPLAAAVWPLIGRKKEDENLENAHSYLSFVGLSEMSNTWAERVSYGQQKLVAIARLLNNGGDCLLLDEPTAGVHPDMVSSILDVIRNLAGMGKTIIVIEHDLGVVRKVGDWVYLMDEGRIESFGTPSEILGDAAIRRVFPPL